METPPMTHMVTKPHDLLVFAWPITWFWLEVGPFGCLWDLVMLGTAGRWPHGPMRGWVGCWGLLLQDPPVSVSFETGADTRMRDVLLGEIVHLCLFSSFQPNFRDVRILQIHREPVDVVINITRVAHFHPWQILTKICLFSTPLASSPASPRWVLDSKENLNY